MKLNVMALQDSTGFDAEQLTQGVELSNYGLMPSDLTELKRLFEHATTFGSLIQVPERLVAKLPALKQLSEATSQDLFVSEALKRLGPLVQQAELLATQYDGVVMNPPYMGSKGINGLVKEFTKHQFPDAKSDLFACFIERSYTLAKAAVFIGMVTMQSWMFLSSFKKMRERMLREKTITTMAQIGFNSFPSLNSKIALATTFSILNRGLREFSGTFFDLNSAPRAADKNQVFLQRDPACRFHASALDLNKIPGSPVAYWVSDAFRDVFVNPSIEEITVSDGQNKTGDNDKYLRMVWEVAESTVGAEKRWLPYAKGGGFRRWHGNLSEVVDWSPTTRKHYKTDRISRIIPEYLWFKVGITWGLIALIPSFRLLPRAATFDVGGSSVFFKKDEDLHYVLAACRKSREKRPEFCRQRHFSEIFTQ